MKTPKLDHCDNHNIQECPLSYELPYLTVVSPVFRPAMLTASQMPITTACVTYGMAPAHTDVKTPSTDRTAHKSAVLG